MAVSRRVIARFIAKELMGDTPQDVTMQKLAAYLVTHKMQAESELVVADILRELAARGAVEARVTTARPLTADLRKTVSDYVKQAESAQTVMLRETVDESLIGGIVIETPRKRLDASVASQVRAIAKA